MDGVIVDFYSHPNYKVPKDSWNHENIYKETYFSHLSPLEGAIESVKALIATDRYEVYICTHPLEGSPSCFSEKADWIKRWLPELEGRMILACDKSLVRGDFLIDDSLRWKDGFTGYFVHFNHEYSSGEMWERILERFNTNYVCT